MDQYLPIDGSLERTYGQNELSAQESLAIRFTSLSSWMMILGTVRLVSALGDYGSSFLDISSSGYPALKDITWFFHENPPAVLLGTGWPLFLGFLLRKPSNRGFLVAGAVTFFILSLGGFLSLVTSVSMHSAGFKLSIGSFVVGRASLWHGNFAAAIRAMMGVVQLVLELVTAVSAWGLYQSLRTDAASTSAEAAESRRGSLCGRLAIYVSLAFFVLIVRQPVWSTYLTALNQSNLLRQFVLRNDVRSSASSHWGNSVFQSPPAVGDISLALASALQLAASNRLPEAKETYLRIISKAEYNSRGPGGVGLKKKQAAPALNDLAWMLATCEDVQFREPERALEYAQKAVELADDEGTYWNTLGVAYFRLQDWDEATKALGRSMELRANGEGDSYDWFFLAMIHASKNQEAEGRRWYDRAVDWFHTNRAGDRELYRFQVEAAKALGMPKPPLPLVATQPPKPAAFAKPGVIRRGARLTH